MSNKKNVQKVVKINIQDWRKKIGTELVSNIIILLAGLNRLYALVDFMHLSY